MLVCSQSAHIKGHFLVRMSVVIADCSSPGYSFTTNCQMAIPERIHYQHLVQAGSTQQHQCG